MIPESKAAEWPSSHRRAADHRPAPATGGAQRPEGASGGMRAAAHTYHAAAGDGGGDERQRAGGGDEQRCAGERAQAGPRPVFKGALTGK